MSTISAIIIVGIVVARVGWRFVWPRFRFHGGR